MSICYNIDNLICILKCIDKNKEELAKIESESNPKKPLMSSFKRLYKEENLEKLMRFAEQIADKNITAYMKEIGTREAVIKSLRQEGLIK